MTKDVIATTIKAAAISEVILSEITPPITPTVAIYLAISINILPASLRLSSCLTKIIYHKFTKIGGKK